MPPLAASHSSDSSEGDGIGFEIEAESHNGRLIVSNILLLSADEDTTIKEFDPIEEARSVYEPDPLEPIYEDEESECLLSSIENVFSRFTCGYDGDETCKPLKSALKKSSSRTPTPIRNVSFNKLEIREYDMTLGDHPSATTGPPMTLDWMYKPEHVLDVEVYERGRQPRRKRKQLRLSYRDRERVLYQEKGFTQDEVNAAWLEALMVRKQRSETVRQSEAENKMEEVWESTQRKISRLFRI